MTTEPLHCQRSSFRFLPTSQQLDNDSLLKIARWNKHLRFMVLTLIVVGVIVPRLIGQVTPDLDRGVKPYGSWDLNGVDSVNMNNGNLHVRIPLYSASQRGSMGLSFSLVFNENSFSYLNSCGNNVCTQSYGLFEDFGVNVKWDQELDFATTQRTTQQGSSVYYSPESTITEADGSAHPLGYDASAAGLSTLRATDGTRYTAFLPYSYTSPDYQNPNTTILTADGVHYQPIIESMNGVATKTGVNLIDADGNQITAQNPQGVYNSTPQFTDTLSRTVPNPAGLIDYAIIYGTLSTSTTGCPTLSASYQPLVGSVNWMPPGTSKPYLFCLASVSVRTNFFGIPNGQTSECTVGTNSTQCEREAVYSRTAIQSVVLPDGSAWSFTYDSANPQLPATSIGYGDLLSMTFPTGGTLLYTYTRAPITCVNNANAGSQRAVGIRTLAAGDGTQYKTMYTWGVAADDTSGLALLTNIRNDPGKNDTVFAYKSLQGSNNVQCAGYESTRTEYQGLQASNATLRSTTTTYYSSPDPQGLGQYGSNQAGVFPETEATTLYDITGGSNNVTSTKSYVYDTGFNDVEPACASTLPQTCFTYTPTSSVGTQAISFGKQTHKTISAWNSTGSVQSTSTSYRWQADDSYKNANLFNTPSLTSVSDATGTLSSTTYSYDEANYLTQSSIGPSQQHISSPNGTVRGHPTTVMQAVSDTASVSVHTNWWDTGEKYIEYDGRNNKAATYTYSSTYAGAYPTNVVDALNRTTVYAYDSNTGQVISKTDPNSQVTNYNYDSIGRLWTVHNPDSGAATNFSLVNCYPSSTAVIRMTAQTTALSSPNDDTTCSQAAPSGVLVQSSVFDGVGRLSKTINTSTGLEVDQNYDRNGKIYTISEPEAIGSSQLASAITTFTYDAIGRINTQQHPDKTNRSWSYVGASTILTDELAHNWSSTYDPINRLVGVVEPGSLNTSYTYSGTTTTVNQQGNNGPQESARTRSFRYDLLSRLITANNSETGTVCYGTGSGSSCTEDYDGNGNLNHKTDALGVVTAYSYDALNRITQKSFSDGGLSSCYAFDNSAGGNSVANGIGRLTLEWRQSGACPSSIQTLPIAGAVTWRSIASYDPMGRILSEQQCAHAPCTSVNTSLLQYTYDLAGSLTSTTNGLPAGVSPQLTFTMANDSAGRLNSVISSISDANHPANLFNAPVYGAYGLTSANFGVGSASSSSVLSEVRGYDVRGRVNQIIGSTNQSAAVLPTPTVTVNLDTNPVVQGQSATARAQVSCNTACGTVRFFIDSIEVGVGTLTSDSKTTFALDSNLSLGNHTLVAQYLGNASFSPAVSNSVTFAVVAKASPALYAALSVSPVVQGYSPRVVTAINCSSACGNITYSIAGQTFASVSVNGDGSVSAPALPSTLTTGSYTVSLSYNGNASNNATTFSFPVSVVGSVSQSMTTTIDVNPIPADENPWMRSHVSCGSCGNVLYHLNSAGLGFSGSNASGEADLLIAQDTPYVTQILVPGWYILSADYVGSGSARITGTALAVRVIPETMSEPYLAASLASPQVFQGTAPTVASVTNCASSCGYITFFADAGTPNQQVFQRYQILPDGAVSPTFLPSSLGIGDHTLTVKYDGDQGNAPASTTVTFNVVGMPSLYAALSLNPVQTGTSPRVLTVTNCTTACGTATYSVDGTQFQQVVVQPDGSVVAPSLSSTIAAGTHSLTVSLAGSQIGTKTITIPFKVVTATPVSITLSSALNPAPSDSTSRIGGQMGCNACGYVYYHFDGLPINFSGINSTGGAYNSLVPGFSGVSNVLPPGRHILTMEYTGAAAYSADGSNTLSGASILLPVVAEINSPPAFSISLSSTAITQGSSTVVTTHTGCTNACGMVLYYLENSTQAIQGYDVQADGTVPTVTTSPSLAIGYRRIIAKYSGDSTHAPATQEILFNIRPTQ